MDDSSIAPGATGGFEAGIGSVLGQETAKSLKTTALRAFYGSFTKDFGSARVLQANQAGLRGNQNALTLKA